MDKLHIMTVLGTGNYSPVFYENKEHGTDKYVQSAIVRKFVESDRDIKVTVYMTEESKRIHGEALMTTLGDEFPEITLNAVLIPFGKSEAEIMNIFETIYEQIEENDEIIFDMTHSFRSIPMIIMAVLQYARVLKSCRLKGIYYGAFEAREDDVAPIIDLSLFNSIVEWSFAAEQFSKYGNAAPIERAFSNDKKIVESMVNLADCITVNRGSLVGDINSKNVSKTSIKKAFDKFENVSLSEIDMIGKKPLSELIEYAKRRYAVLDQERDYEVGLAVVGLCIKFNMVSQGYTALDETIKTYVCEANGLDCNDKRCREDIVAIIFGTKEKYLCDNKDADDTEAMWNFYINENERSMKVYQEAEDEDKIKIKRAFEFVDKDLIKLRSSISGCRNDINHFGYRKAPLSVSKLQSKLKTHYEQAKKIMNYNESGR